MKTFVVKLNNYDLKTLRLKHVIPTQKESVYCVVNPTADQERELIDLKGPFIEDGGLLFDASLDSNSLVILANGQSLKKVV